MKFLFPILFLFLFSCSINSRLNKKFIGADLNSVEESLKMKATQVQKLDNGMAKVTFIKEKDLGATPISKGEGTLDPLTSPPVSKREYYFFILDENGKVIRTDYQKEYESK